MPILIDGHNLIGRMPALSLADPDDERQLLALLLSYREPDQESGDGRL